MRTTVMSFMETVYEKVKGRGARVVYPEGLEERAIKAAAWLQERDLVVPVLIGSAAGIREKAASIGASLDGVEIRDPEADPRREDFVADYVELRKHKGMTPEKAAERLALPHFFAAMAIRADEAVGMVSGLNSETKPFIPPSRSSRSPRGTSACRRSSSWPGRTRSTSTPTAR